MFRAVQRFLTVKPSKQVVKKTWVNNNLQKNFLSKQNNNRAFLFSSQFNQAGINNYNHTEGIRINTENMEYFNINMDMFYSDEKYKNPEQKFLQKQLTDVQYKNNMTVKQLSNILEEDIDVVRKSVSLIGADNLPDSILSFEEAEIVCYEFNHKLLPLNYNQIEKTPKPPVITIMGHVDHGKTTLLDTLRSSNIVDGEFGGITQKIGAFHNITEDGQRITYIDTPGHEAFTNMRIRGASSTDMIVLVVSAVEGIQPQTLEVISIAQTNNLPIMVAINKIDVDGADPENVEEQLYQKGGLHLETHGGNIPVLHISAKENINIDLLKELILFETELLELEEVSVGNAEAVVLESRKCQETQQQSCTVIVQRGSLKTGDYLIVGNEYIKVKQLKDDRNAMLKEALPSYAVEITGLKNLASAGDICFVVDSENKAKLICQRRKWRKEQEQGQTRQISASSSKIKFQTRRERRKFHSGNKELIQEKFNQVEQGLLEKIQMYEGVQETRELEQWEMDELVRAKVDLDMHREYVKQMIQGEQQNEDAVNLIVKAVDYGTRETLVAQIYQLASKFTDVEFNLVGSGVGVINENDIRDAAMRNAHIISMDVTVTPEAQKLAKQEGVDIKTHRIIYSILDDLKQMLNKANNKDKLQLIPMGNAVVKNVFKVKTGKGKNSMRIVAGLGIQKGVINKKHMYMIRRNGELVGEQVEIANLKHFKSEVQEMKKGEECGVIFFNFNDLQPGDVIEGYEVQDYEGEL